MNDLARLVAIEDIKQLKARYYRLLDTHDWEGFRSVWTPDAIMDVNFPDRILTSEDGIYRGPDAITAFAMKAVGAATSIDHALMPEIEILTATTGVRNLIRRGEDHQIYTALSTGRAEGMITMEQSLAEMTRNGRITRETAMAHGFRSEALVRYLEG